MAKISKEDYVIAKQQNKDLLKLLLQKTGVAHKEIVDLAEQQFIVANLDVLTAIEKKRFNKLVL
ncbi:MAG: hypothetical protein LBU51_02440 [Bacteroidales bacterium]|jgi:hypothetical protein|nr:hypothetical protein [Bacteroidales bacterium]